MLGKNSIVLLEISNKTFRNLVLIIIRRGMCEAPFSYEETQRNVIFFLKEWQTVNRISACFSVEDGITLYLVGIALV